MISIEEGQLSKNLGKIRREARWSRGRRGPSHDYSKTILIDNQLLKSL
jgi:hypothetical protein